MLEIYKIQFKKRFQDEFKSIIQYSLSNFGETSTDLLEKRIFLEIKSLSTFPKRSSKHRKYYICLIDSFVAFYTVDDVKLLVTIHYLKYYRQLD